MTTIIKFFSILASKIRWMGWASPFWFVYKPRDWKLTGKQLSEIMCILDTGDLLITRVDSFISTWLIPGWWNHAGVCVTINSRNLDERIIHAIGKGVMNSHILDFLRADHAVILRPKCGEDARRAVGIAKDLEGGGYDFDYDFSDPSKLTCTELAALCYEAIEPKKTWLGEIVKADDIVALDSFRIIWDSRK